MSCFYFTGMDVMECDKDVTRSTVLTTSLRLIRGMKDYIWTLNEARMYEIKIRRLLEKIGKNDMREEFQQSFQDGTY